MLFIILEVLFGLSISELLSLIVIILTFFSGIIYMNVKLSKVETKVDDIIVREKEREAIVIETARILKEATIETAKVLRETTLETARLLSVTLEQKEDKLKSIDEKVDRILLELIPKNK